MTHLIQTRRRAPVMAGGYGASFGNRSVLVNNVGMLCLIIDGGNGKAVKGGVSLQKTAYFCQYLGWPLRDYKLDYYGPFSQTLAETVADAEAAGLIKNCDGEPDNFQLTDDGREVLALFTEEVCDQGRADATRHLAERLSNWPHGELEIASTIDYVASYSRMSKGDLVDKVHSIKPTHPKAKIARAYTAWRRLVRDAGMAI